MDLTGQKESRTSGYPYCRQRWRGRWKTSNPSSSEQRGTHLWRLFTLDEHITSMTHVAEIVQFWFVTFCSFLVVFFSSLLAWEEMLFLIDTPASSGVIPFTWVPLIGADYLRSMSRVATDEDVLCQTTCCSIMAVFCMTNLPSLQSSQTRAVRATLCFLFCRVSSVEKIAVLRVVIEGFLTSVGLECREGTWISKTSGLIASTERFM